MHKVLASPGFWVAMLIPVVILALPLGIGVWLPDVITAKKHTLGEITTREGYHYRVIQYWNRGDFYSTELHLTRPDGTTHSHTLDGDDSKHWSAEFRVNEANRAVMVTWGERQYTEAWDQPKVDPALHSILR